MPEHCNKCNLWSDGIDCEKCGKRLMREQSTSEKLAELERAGYITN